MTQRTPLVPASAVPFLADDAVVGAAADAFGDERFSSAVHLGDHVGAVDFVVRSTEPREAVDQEGARAFASCVASVRSAGRGHHRSVQPRRHRRRR
jgi:hypothetical protein